MVKIENFKKKDRGYKAVIIGTVIFISTILFNFLSFLLPELLSFTFLVPILLCVGIVLVVIGGLTKEKKDEENIDPNS